MSGSRWRMGILHGVIIAAPFVVLAGLTWHHLAPSGTFTVAADTLEQSPYINRILPIARAPVSAEGDWVTLVDEPAYFSVVPPKGSYDSATVTVDFAANDQRVVELGLLADLYAQAYDLEPLRHAVLDELPWDRLVEDGRVLYVRNGAPNASIDHVLGTIDDRSTLAVYHEDYAVPYREWNYQPLGGTRALDVSLRGYHKFVTYVDGESFSLDVTYMDMNRTTGPDTGAVRVWNESGEVVLEKTFSDDDNTTENQMETARLTLSLASASLPTGVYTVELTGTSDIFWRRIVTSQRYVTFINRIYIGDDVAYLPSPRPTSFVTSAKHLALETFHADSPQEITAGGMTITIPQSGEITRATITEAGTVAGRTPVGDIRMTGDGLFAFTADAFFNPYPVQVNAYTDVDAQGIEYILASYARPEDQDGWQRASAAFRLAGVPLENGAYKFTFSAPTIADSHAGVDIRRITVAFHKSPMSAADVLRVIMQWIQNRV